MTIKEPAPPQPYPVPESTPHSTIHNSTPNRVSQPVCFRWSRIDNEIEAAWDFEETDKPTQTCLEMNEPTPTLLDRGFSRNAVDRPVLSTWHNLDLGAWDRAVREHPTPPTHRWLQARLVPGSAMHQPAIKQSGAAPWQWISSCCPGWVCGNYWLPSPSWEEDMDPSTATTRDNWTSLWQWMFRSISPALAIRSVCDGIEFVYLRAEEDQTVFEVRARLEQCQSYEASEVLSIFPLASNLWELLIHRSYVSRLKGRAPSVGYIVEEGCHPAKPPTCPFGPRDRAAWRHLAIERLVARAVAVDLLSEAQRSAKSDAASVYLRVVMLYQCSHVFRAARWALSERGGLGEVKAEVACSFSKREAYKDGVSPKDLENQLCYLVCKLKCASHPSSSKPSHPTPSKRPSHPPPSKRPFTFHENVVLLAWAVGFDVLPPELRGSRKRPNGESPTDHLNLWKKSIDLAKVAKTLTASPLWHNKDGIPSRKEVKGALDVVGGVLQPTGVEHLQTPATARKRPSHGSISRAASRQRLGNMAEDPETQPLPEFLKQEPAADLKEEPAVDLKEEPAADLKEEPAVDLKEEPAADLKEEPAVDLKEEPAVEGWIDTLQRKDGEPRDARIKKEDLGG